MCLCVSGVRCWGAFTSRDEGVVVCRLVLQALVGRQWARDAKPAKGVVGLDMLSPGQLTRRWPPHSCPGRLGPALDWGPPAHLHFIGTGGAD